MQPPYPPSVADSDPIVALESGSNPPTFVDTRTLCCRITSLLTSMVSDLSLRQIPPTIVDSADPPPTVVDSLAAAAVVTAAAAVNLAVGVFLFRSVSLWRYLWFLSDL